MKLLVMADARSVHTERWCRYFEEAGVETALFSLEPCTISPPGRLFQGRRPTSQGIVDYFLARKNFLAVLKDFQPDIVNAHYVVSYGWLATVCKSCPVVVTAWGSDLLILPHKSIIHRKRIAKALNHARYCTVDNRNLFEAATKFVAADKIIEVIMGVDRQVFDRVRKNERPAGMQIRIIAPRGLQPVYDPGTIIRAAEKLKGQIDLHIDLFGQGSDVDRLQDIIDEKSLTDMITMKPFVAHDEYIDGLKNCDLYLSASRSDSTSVALLEAMAAGLVPVVSDIAGNREWITADDNGFLFQCGSSDDLARNLKKAVAALPDWTEMAQANRRLISDKAIWQDNMDRLKIIFERLAG
ncbi:MAG: glycosyltransferase family 4 protein [FCB group bacterium]|nr:glycosyltransferase family 4 protein [FCB group bacterium]